MAGLRASLFGKLLVTRDGNPIGGIQARKVQELLCYLLVYRQHPQSREVLAELLWDDLPSARSRKYLRQVLWKLQTTLADATCEKPDLLVEPHWVQLNPSCGHWLDIDEFERTFQAVNPKRAVQLLEGDYAAMQAAVSLYTGDLLEGWYQDWCIFERERFQVMLMMLLDKLIQYCEIHGDYDAGLAYGAELLRHDPAYERAHRQIMRLYSLTGDRTQALRQYQRCVSALQDDLGVQPSGRTTQLYEQICSDRFRSPYRQRESLQVERGGEENLEEALDRLEHFSTSLKKIQLQVRKEIKELEEHLQPRR